MARHATELRLSAGGIGILDSKQAERKNSTINKRWLFALFPALAARAVMAVEVATCISDRETIEPLAELKAGQKLLTRFFIVTGTSE